MRTLKVGLLAGCLVAAMAIVGAAYSIAIFVPGVVAGSPTYELMVEGVNKAAAEYDDVTVKVLEAGFDQSTWEEQMVNLAATEEYDLIVSANGAMPFVSMAAADAFPDQKFLFVDSIIAGHPQMYTVLYNQVEQTAMLGYLAGLVTTSDMAGANPDLKVGMIVGQEYAAMDNMLRPGYALGAKLVNPDIEVDFRVLGNWYDANKAGELANSMIDAGVDIIITGCGGANQGVIQTCKERGKYVLYLDDDAYDLAPGIIAGCAAIISDKATYEKVKAAIEGELVWGEYEVLSTAEGYVDFVDWNPLFEGTVSPDVAAKLAVFLADLRSSNPTWLKARMVVPVYW